MNFGTQPALDDPSKLIEGELSKEIIGVAIEVHRHLVEDKIILELKAVESILKVHEAQLLTYLRLIKKRVGFILNFHVSQMSKGLLRKVL